MYNELVKELLQKHFGTPRSSLTVGDTAEPAGRTFYYSFEKEKEIAAVRELLEMKHLVDGIEKLPELKQSIPDRDDDIAEVPQCVCLSESDGNWRACFHKIKGVRYRRTYGNRVAATLEIDDFPFVVLSDRDEEFYSEFDLLYSELP